VTDTGTDRTVPDPTAPAVPEAMSVVTDLPARTSVQPDSTVSSTVLRAEGARVVLFAFDAGQELSEHTAAVPALLQVLSGKLAVTASGRTVDLVQGGLVHLPTRLPHAVLALEPTVLQLTLLDDRTPTPPPPA
jgi:quercetin dioxygenase-like cupin family protein